MPTIRRLTVLIALLVIALAISLICNGIQSTSKARLDFQNQSLENELKNQRKMARQQLHPSPASATDIQTGLDIVAIHQKLHQRPVQIVIYDQELADSGWLVINLPYDLSSYFFDLLDITLFYRDQNGERDHERAIFPTQRAKDCFNGTKQRLEIPVSRHLSSLCSLRFIHANGTSWNFSIIDSKLVYQP